MRSRYFGNSEPFALIVGWSKIVVIRDFQDVAAVWKNTTALSFDPFVMAVMKSFGIAPASVERIYAKPENLIHGDVRSKSLLINENPSQKSYIHIQSDWLKLQLLSRDRLEKLQDTYQGYLEKSLVWNNLSCSYIISCSCTSESKKISLRDFCRYTVSRCGMNTFFGEKLLQVAPSFPQDYQKFEDDSWKIFYHFPHILAKDLHLAKDRAIDALVEYLALPEEQRPGLTWIFETMNIELGYLALPPRDKVGIIILITWA